MSFVPIFEYGPIAEGWWTNQFRALGYEADGQTIEFPWLAQRIVEWDKIQARKCGVGILLNILIFSSMILVENYGGMHMCLAGLIGFILIHFILIRKRVLFMFLIGI